MAGQVLLLRRVSGRCCCLATSSVVACDWHFFFNVLIVCRAVSCGLSCFLTHSCLPSVEGERSHRHLCGRCCFSQTVQHPSGDLDCLDALPRRPLKNTHQTHLALFRVGWEAAFVEQKRKEKRTVCCDLPECFQSGDLGDFGRQATSKKNGRAADNGEVGDDLLGVHLVRRRSGQLGCGILPSPPNAEPSVDDVVELEVVSDEHAYESEAEEAPIAAASTGSMDGVQRCHGCPCRRH